MLRAVDHVQPAAGSEPLTRDHHAGGTGVPEPVRAARCGRRPAAGAARLPLGAEGDLGGAGKAHPGRRVHRAADYAARLERRGTAGGRADEPPGPRRPGSGHPGRDRPAFLEPWE
ncbi:glyoxalase [Streptomyces sp. NPDC048018]|uniref:glyoxalase n=1 Tax=Streptomyces sp. NPDC048018 TaxID=3365499 RepID=UPI0037237DE8